MKMSKTFYDLNSLLIFANIVICGTVVYLYGTKDGNTPVNVFTIVLVCIFAMENIGMLSYEKKMNNPFIIILVLVTTVFYMLRVATIIHIPASVSLYEETFVPSANELNYTLTFIFLSNAVMFLGFYLGGKNIATQNKVTCEDDNVPKIRNAIVLILILIFIDFSNVSSTELFGRFTGYIQYIFNRHTILLFTFTMLVYHYNKISLRNLMLFMVLTIAVVILTTLSGSRSSILSVAMLLLMSVLAVKQRIMISKKIIIICLILIPLSFILFATATLKRQLGITANVSVEQLYAAKESEIFDFDNIEHLLVNIYYRLGYLNWSADLIANTEKFATIINSQYYFKSIIDNVLSPGFDVFNTRKASLALSYVNTGQNIPDDVHEVSQSYLSSQMGIYGEYYVLFYGYPALVVFFFLAFMIQRIYVNFKSKNNFRYYLYTAVMLNLFYLHLNSYGIDWFAMDVVTSIITVFLFVRFYDSKRCKKNILMPTQKGMQSQVVA